MALRRRKPEQTAYGGGLVPVALLDKSDDVWKSKQATRRWLAEFGLEWTERMEAGPLNRHKEATYAWAMLHGPVRELENGHRHPAWDSLRDLGIPGHGGGALREHMVHLGVRDL